MILHFSKLRRITGFIPIFIAFALIASPLSVQAQHQELNPLWVQKMYAPNADIGEVQKLFETYYLDHDFVKNEHTQYYKRWLRNISRDQTGEFNNRLTTAERQQIQKNNIQYQSRSKDVNRSSSSNWVGIGPYDWDHDAASKSYAAGAAHIYTVEQAPSNTDILYAGTATGGAWKSIDHGLNWSCLTCDQMDNRAYALDIHPTNPNIVLLDLLNNVYKTTDGGVNWTPTGNSTFQALTMDVLDILFHRNNGDIAFAATSEGLYRTANQGTSWTAVITDKVQEIQHHPTNNSIFYAVEQVGDVTKFYRSIDAGVTFQLQSGGWPAPSSPDQNRRAEIAVSPDQPDKVVALLTGAVNGGNGLYGIYTSTDQGSTWSFSCCGPQPGGLPNLATSPPNINMMAWADDGSDDGGQYYYDVGLAVSPTDADSIFVGGVNMWVSGDGGTTFTCPSKWSHSNKPNYVHADIHDINYFPSGELWIACDGGIFYSNDNGANINRRMTGIHGSDFWGYGANFWSGNVMLGGAYHNGTLIKNDSIYINGWHCIDGGDGTGGFANPGLEKRVYSNYNIKDLPNDRLTSIPTRGYAQKPYTHYIVGRSSTIAFHPENYSVQYFGKDDCIYKTEDDHYSATALHCFGEAVADVEVSIVNPDYVYVTTFFGHWDEKKIYRSTDGGINWTDITPSSTTIPSKRWIPYDLTLSDIDPNIIYMARVANSVTTYDGEKVYKSTNGGASWVNLTTSTLDGEQLTNVVYQRGTDEGLWLGTRRTVYYKSNNISDWTICNSDLPASTFSTKLVINYRTQKIRNATNRSVYETSLVESSIPEARPSVDKTYSACTRDTFYFSDYSSLSEVNASWTWSFPGASYVSSYSSRQPHVIYGNPGMYDVSLTVSDINGSDQKTITDMISVDNICTADSVPGNTMTCKNSGDYATNDMNLNTVNFTATAWIKPSAIHPEFAGIFISGGSQAGFNFKTNNRLGYHWPGGQWWWTSNHTVPIDEWSYVAMVASPTGMTLYLNGIGETHSINLDTAYMTNGYIGSYRGWGSRNFTGEIEEMTIWNRSLSEAEIREHMHITRDKIVNGITPDPSLFAYYQFNEPSGSTVYDRVGLRHAQLVGGSSLISSSAPVGGGSASTLTITSTGSYLFPNEHARLVFNQPAGIPNGSLVVSEINHPPHLLPAYSNVDNKYWAIHSFGAASDIIIDSLYLYSPSAGVNLCEDYFLFNRGFNAEGNTWGNALSIGSTCSGNWFSFPSKTYGKATQVAASHYDGNFYVDINSTAGNGANWLSAFPTLQPAVNNAANGDTIFVTQGTYYPANYARDCIGCTSDRQFTIHPRSGVTLLGGFPRFGGNLASRDWLSQPSIISGAHSSNPSNNAYHVLYVDELSSNITFDGFYIQDGLANGATIPDKNGGALLCYGNIQFANMEFSRNESDSSIIYINGAAADVHFTNSTSLNNTSGSTILDVDSAAKVLIDGNSKIE